MQEIHEIGMRARQAQTSLAAAGSAKTDQVLRACAAAIRKKSDYILYENAKDIRAAEENGLNESLIERLTLTEARIDAMANGILEVAAAPTPVGRVLWGETRPNGLKIEKVTVPIGVIAVIYESRPNVTADAAAICLKAGNAVILKGGKEAQQSNKAIAETMRSALADCGLDADCLILLEDATREDTAALMKLNDCIDLLIPRGGAGLIRSVIENATVPVIETGVGNCHVYVDKDADTAMAAAIVENAKASRVSVCNACESLLIHKEALERTLPAIAERLRAHQVEMRGDEAVCDLLEDALPAEEADWGKEYLDYIISIKTVESVEEAIAHIRKYGTGHSEAIVTENYQTAERFQQGVDAAAVYVNASTRFTDGGEFGFGAEIGISTQKLHARGPLGIAHMVSEKYLIRGNGQIR
ncbi:MAG: glutamate-5-semialdehyde dehydrogenase [Clostridia bacterium]|nr:glutamate-5-semialdehyde dehydrogenase [Clostridia bacterium]